MSVPVNTVIGLTGIILNDNIFLLVINYFTILGIEYGTKQNNGI